jgi:hypothetical protein
MLYRYCPDIPPIPGRIINKYTEEEIRKIPRNFSGITPPTNVVPKYSLHTVPPEIKTFLSPYFDDGVNMSFQLITQDLPIHKDYGRTNCYNYIISTGGNVNTVWYDDNLNETQRISFSDNSWHNIMVNAYHNITNLTSTRIAITVHTPDTSAIGDIQRI